MDRTEVKGWVNAHNRNKWLVTQAIGSLGTSGTDVVFVGDQTVQAWDGRWLDRMAPEGNRIANYFNQTFRNKDSAFQGLALGIYGDRVSRIDYLVFLSSSLSNTFTTHDNNNNNNTIYYDYSRLTTFFGE
jgi:hypothetical protein